MISIIIPAYNAEKSIQGCLDSLLTQQDYDGEKEVIVVDDGSTDKTRDLVSKYNITLLRQDHKGPAAARNLGARTAKGRVILFIDADCVADKSWISEMFSPFQESGIAGVQGVYRTTQKDIVARFSQLEIENRYKRMLARNSIDFIGTYAAAYTRQVFLENDGFHEGFQSASGEDPDLSFRLADKGHKLVMAPKAIVYHQHPSTIGKYLKQKFYRAYWRVLLYKRHKSKMISESYTPQTLKIQIALLYASILLAGLSLFFPIGIVTLLLIIALFLSTASESYSNLRKDPLVGILSPLLLLMRTAAFSLGLVVGTIKTRA